MACRRFMGVGQEAKHVWSDGSEEINASLKKLAWVHDTSTPNRPATNSLIETANKRVKEGTSACLVQAGLDDQWWDLAMCCYCFLRNVVDQLVTTSPLALCKEEQPALTTADDIPSATAYKQKFQADFRGPIIPFGARVDYKPSSDRDIEDMPKMGTKLRKGIFVGYDQISGGGWSGDLYVLDCNQLSSAQAIYDVYVRRIKAEEVFADKDAVGNFVFPCADGSQNQPLGTSKSFKRFEKSYIADDEDFECDTVVDEEGDTRTEESDAMEDKGDSEDVLDRDPFERTEDEKDGEDYWSLNENCLVRHHRVPRRKLFSLFDVTKNKPPIPLDYVDIRRETFTSLESPSESAIYDTWWAPSAESREPDRILSAYWTGKTIFNLLMNVPKPGYEWCEGEQIKIAFRLQGLAI